MPKVLNKRTDTIPADAIYVGRPTKWGNPYKVGDKFTLLESDRETCISRYRLYLLFNIRLMQDLHELRDKDLVCWCAPLPCHADVLLELANREVNHGI